MAVSYSLSGLRHAFKGERFAYCAGEPDWTPFTLRPTWSTDCGAKIEDRKVEISGSPFWKKAVRQFDQILFTCRIGGKWSRDPKKTVKEAYNVRIHYRDVLIEGEAEDGSRCVVTDTWKGHQIAEVCGDIPAELGY